VVYTKPSPTRTESCRGGFRKFVFESLKRTKCGINRFSQFPAWFTTTVRAHNFPKQIVVVISATIVTDSSLAGAVFQNFFDCPVLHFSPLNGVVQIIGVSRM